MRLKKNSLHKIFAVVVAVQIILFSTLYSFNGLAIAQESSQSAVIETTTTQPAISPTQTPETTIPPTPTILPTISPLPQTATDSSLLKNKEVKHSLKGEMDLYFEHDDFQAKENPTFIITFPPIASSSASLFHNFIPSLVKPAFAQDSQAATISAKILNSEGKDVSIPVNINQINQNTFNIEIQKKPSFEPGKFTLVVQNGSDSVSQDFNWGVLAINVDKSIYLSNEKSDIQMAVLDEQGKTVCDASLELKIQTKNSSSQDILSTENGKITINPECQTHEVTQKPDYEALYQVGGPDTYQMTLTAKTKNGIYTISDSFEVKNDVPFDVQRDGPTRIYPPNSYPVTLKIISHQDFDGTVIETVPASFDVSPALHNRSYDSVETQKDVKILKWQISARKGDQFALGYNFKAPTVSPYFYLLGPLRIGDFTETRQWQIAADATTDTFTASTTWTAPTGVTSVTAEVWGGGGGGGGQNLSSDGGGGGGGGAYSIKVVTVSPGSYTVTVGTGGTGSAGCTASTAGGDSWFSTSGTVMAKGGSPGVCSTGTPPAGGLGGVDTSGVGDTRYSGGQGEIGRNSTTGRGGYGGSSAGTATNGWSGPQTWSTETYPTASTPTGGGHGGNGGAAGANGNAPASGNGGGGGGAGDTTPAKTGGAGAVGKVILTYNKPPNAPSQDSPANSATVSTTPTFLMTATDADTTVDNLSYKVTIYSNSGCTTVVQTNDQAVSSTGWTGTNATCTASPTSCYTSGTQGSYATQTALSYSTQYWWKASAKDPDGNGSFTNSSTCNTFTTASANSAPNSPTSLVQKKVTGGATLATGDWTNETQVQFAASASDPNNPDTLQLCVEKDILGTAFSNTEDLCGTGVAYSGTAVTVTVTITGITDANEYHWQARVKDAAAAYSAWVSYDVNLESARDFGVDTTAPTGGTVYDGTSTGVDAQFNDGSLSALSANWSGLNANASGLLRYDYAIGTTAGGTDVVNWTSNSTTTSVTVGSLTLQTSKIYYFSVRAVDNAGNIQTGVYSDGQAIAPTLTFSLNPTSVAFVNLNATNSYTDTQNTTVTTSTNAYNGYVIRIFTTQNLTSTIYPSTTIGGFTGGTYAVPAAYGGGDTGFGVTSSDSLVQGSNKFAPSGGVGTLYFPPSLTGAGNIVADNPGLITGSPITNEQFTITYKVITSQIQAASPYSTTAVYTTTPQY